jgi:hypothetical protein
MAIASQSIVDAVVSHAQSLGLFEQVHAHEPANPPANGRSAAVWVQRIGPALGQSGLASTTAALLLSVRIYTPIIQDPADQIDQDMLLATDALMAAYTGDFTLGGLIKNVDLMGERTRAGLQADAGYLEQDRRIYRTMTINLPLVINDLWDQAP